MKKINAMKTGIFFNNLRGKYKYLKQTELTTKYNIYEVLSATM